MPTTDPDTSSSSAPTVRSPPRLLPLHSSSRIPRSARVRDCRQRGLAAHGDRRTGRCYRCHGCNGPRTRARRSRRRRRAPVRVHPSDDKTAPRSKRCIRYRYHFTVQAAFVRPARRAGRGAARNHLRQCPPIRSREPRLPSLARQPRSLRTHDGSLPFRGRSRRLVSGRHSPRGLS